MTEAEISAYVWESALVVDVESRHYRMDMIWAYMRTMKTPDGVFTFQRLATVALLVLHSSAEEERVFSMVTIRTRLSSDQASSLMAYYHAGILTIKLANPEPCHRFDPPPEVLKSSKKATVEYSRAHSSKE